MDFIIIIGARLSESHIDHDNSVCMWNNCICVIIVIVQINIYLNKQLANMLHV